ncbi:MAG: DUF4270 domain-containing protein [Bacteroidia bacterium]|nr:DUF4270 domain-containing protein [Bacteroidia bacterium]MDW8345961.1 DUF4270 family protein [Bacteroidia bacterium]
MKRIPYIIAAVLTLTFWACQKPNNTGAVIQPQDDIIKADVIDTFTFQTQSIARDTLRTDEWNYAVIGQYTDTYFGTTTANFYTQVWLTGSNPVFALDNNENYTVLDSIVLFLQYAHYYGDTANTPLQLSIKEITDTLYKEGIYYSYSNGKNTTGNNLINNTLAAQPISVRPQKVDSIINRKDRSKKIVLRSILRIRLSDNFGQKLLTDNAITPSNFASSTVFTQNYFKGLAFESNSTSSPGVVAVFNMTSPASRIVLYYKIKKKIDDSMVDSTASYDFPFNNPAIARYNTFKRTTTPPNNSAQFSYLQTGVLNEMYLKINDIEKLKNMAINKAELTLHADDVNLFKPSRYLGAYHAGSTAKRKDSILILGAASVSYDSLRKRYTLNLTDYLQAVIIGKLKNNGLIIRPLGYFGSPETDLARTIIHGAQSPDVQRRPRLRVIYTKVQ